VEGTELVDNFRAHPRVAFDVLDGVGDLLLETGVELEGCLETLGLVPRLSRVNSLSYEWTRGAVRVRVAAFVGSGARTH